LVPVEDAVTVTPARPSASMNAVRANADGSSVSQMRSVGFVPATLCLLATSVPGVGSLTVRSVGCERATVLTLLTNV
jgi:hypothetical protein